MTSIPVTEGTVLTVKCLYCNSPIDLDVHTIRWSVWDQVQPIATLEYDMTHACGALEALVGGS